MEFAGLKKTYSRLIGILAQNIKRLIKLNFNFDYPFRVRLGVLILGFFSLLSSWGQFDANRKEFDPKLGVGNDGITLYEQRFIGLKNMLPSHGIVGYVSDAQPYNAEFYLTQYALSPLIVDQTQPHEIVIGNFVNKAVDVNTLTDMRLTLRGDFGNGVKLFSLESK